MNSKSAFVITGASSDLGKAIAGELAARDDVSLILVSRSSDIAALKGHVRVTGVDLTRAAHLRRLSAVVAKHTNAPFTLIHCAGTFWEHKPLVHTPLDELTEMIASHYLTLASTAWALLGHMIERGGGRIIAFSCNSVGYSYPDMAPFTAAKAAVESFIRCIANEYAEFNITANALALPTVRTVKVLQAKRLQNPRSYVSPDDVSRFVLDVLAEAPRILNGNTLKLFRHNRSFFHRGYFERNPRPAAARLVRKSR